MIAKRKNKRAAFLLLSTIFATAAICGAQELTSDTSYVKVREKSFFASNDSLPIFCLREVPPGNDSAVFNPEYGTLVPLFSFSPDSSKILIVVRHAVDAHSYIIVQMKTKQWNVYGNEPSRVYWSRDSKCVAVHEYYLNEAQKIRVIDFSVSPPRVTVAKDSIQPDNEKRFEKIFWRKHSLHYEIVSRGKDGKKTVKWNVLQIK
jgi:hypothetical protein